MKITTLHYETVIVGTGAAGFCAAKRLYDYGIRSAAIVTEGINRGTSRNTGSDKQTYYKMTLNGDDGDCVGEMARTLFSGQAVDGDLAMAEAAESVPSFLQLAQLGVPFPTNRYGEYVGYKTDHDPRKRATSAGPLTSKLMTEALERYVNEHRIPILDHLQMIRILTNGKKVCGILCLDTEEGKLCVLTCRYLVLATGGPAGMYADSVYPTSQHGASGLAFEAGVGGKNLTEWQYGMASVAPRWNVSGSYMQVLPRVVSTAEDGSDEREFLAEAFSDEGEMLSNLFLKGYQWPFDTRKALGGSSRIDLLVYQEHVLKGRRIFLDYRTNPLGHALPWEKLSEEARTYLQETGAVQDTPYARLAHMNQPAIDFYQSHQVDLSRDMLEIALCAQHNNGGMTIDCWWKTNIEGIFSIGEAAGSHGVYRPGGTALNAGQVGATRAAKWISSRLLSDPAACAERDGNEKPYDPSQLPEEAAGKVEETLAWIETMSLQRDNTASLTAQFRRKMSEAGAAFRSASKIHSLREETDALLSAFDRKVGIASDKGVSPRAIGNAFYLYDQLLCMSVYLTAMEDYSVQGGGSRGSALYTKADGQLPSIGSTPLPELFRFLPDDGSRGTLVQEVYRQPDGSNQAVWRPIRPLPDRSGDVFENIWRTYRENRNVY